MFLDRQVEGMRAREISAHSLECIACRTLLCALERESSMLKQAMRDDEEPIPGGHYEPRPKPYGFDLLKTNREPRMGRKQ